MAVHTEADLRQMQSLPLSAKISMTKRRIRDWYEHFDGMVYVSFSGGKDSTVLKHIVDSMYDDVPALFVNTGLEFPEIQQFAKGAKNVVVRRPKMRFDEVLKTYGYPVINKRVASYIASARNDPNCMRAKWIRGEEFTKFVSGGTYTYLIDAPFNISARCCDIMKKAPAKEFAKETGRKAITGEMASESLNRKKVWMETGCNGFDLKEPISKPMAFWTEQDVLHYIKRYNIPYCSVYGEIRVKQNPDECDGQIMQLTFWNVGTKLTHLKRLDVKGPAAYSVLLDVPKINTHDLCGSGIPTRNSMLIVSEAAKRWTGFGNRRRMAWVWGRCWIS